MSQVVLAGGGLANCLIGWRLAGLRPDLDLLLVEAGPALGGNHTWSFHGSDLTPAQHDWIAPLVEHSWPAHEVAFPQRRRRLAGSYHTLRSGHLDRVVSARLGARVVLNAQVATLAPDCVRLADGREFTATLVIDGRGAAGLEAMELAWQKFLGQIVELEAPHGLSVPLLMDATVPQHDGYRFVYLLPFDARRLLIEDTYYSDGPELAPETLRARITDYLAGRGWAVARIEHEETGVLPIVLDGDIDEFWSGASDGVPRAGMRAGLFHGTTGYSLPQAVALADLVAGLPRLDSASVGQAIRAHSRRHWHSQGFFRLLNRLLFRAAPPAERWRVLQHFYRLPEPLVGRFYAGRLRATDPLRILSGRPPVPLLRALRVLAGAAR
jgi:lycopene beta-cyclase